MELSPATINTPWDLIKRVMTTRTALSRVDDTRTCFSADELLHPQSGWPFLRDRRIDAHDHIRLRFIDRG